MNPIAEEILMHYGIKRRSGRYPYGSGEDPYQHGIDFLGRIKELKKQGWTETAENIKKEFGEDMSLRQYRIEKAQARYEERMRKVARAKALRDKGLGDTAIGKEMGLNESSVRELLNPIRESRMNRARSLADFLKEQVNTKGMIDVGTGVERELSIERELRVSKEKLNEALSILEKEGYPVYMGGIPQATNPGHQINQKVLCPPGTEHKEIYNFDKIHTISEYTSNDGGETFDKFVYPKSLDSKRLKILLADDIHPDGQKGIDKDGIIEIRRGVPDLSLGEDHYSQVRILVDDNKYLKGMAVYSDNLPDGVDILFNSNKSSYEKALKPIKNDPDNPFGSLIKPSGQSYYIDKDGNKQLSLINKTRGEGDWNEWKDTLPSQFLGKQSRQLAKKQLDLAKAEKRAEFDSICEINNPTIKKYFLKKFAEECDSASVHLKAAALPGQKYHVIIPINTLKDTEVYAPNYENGTKLALIRYPHGGTFEIPILTVNNKHATARNLIGINSIDAVGINKKNADRLSGADFDGDTVMAIPTDDPESKVHITSTKNLKGLEGFDAKFEYAYSDAELASGKAKIMKNTGTQMGIISNLITDMTLGMATQDELARAVRHSQVVIDAEKHKLNYKQSEEDNNIKGLKEKYQRTVMPDGTIKVGGVSTLLSRAKGEISVTKKQGTPKVNIKGKEWYDPSKPEGALIYKEADDLYYPIYKRDKKAGTVTYTTIDDEKITYALNDREAADRYAPVTKGVGDTGEVYFTNKDGTIKYKSDYRKQQSTRMAETDDAYTLLSDDRHPMEVLYADYANSMKSLANTARKEEYYSGKITYSRTAEKTYAPEVASLKSKVNEALLNAPKERAAQRMANVEVDAKVKANPDMKAGDIKKARQQAINKYRKSIGAVSRRDRNIDISDREWEAIQAGAVSESTLIKILNNTDADELRARATPRASNSLSTAQVSRIRALSNSNYTNAEIAKKMGISPSAVSKYLKGAN